MKDPNGSVVVRVGFPQQHGSIYYQFGTDQLAVFADVQIYDSDLPILFVDRRVLDNAEPSVELGLPGMPPAIAVVAVINDNRVVLGQKPVQDVQHRISKPDVLTHGRLIRFNKKVMGCFYLGVVREESRVPGYIHGDSNILFRLKLEPASRTLIGVYFKIV